MILLLDFTDTRSRVAAISPRGAVWYSVPSGRSAVTALAAARKRKAFAGTPSCIVVALAARGTRREVSWSGVRTAVSSVNAFAFALGIPAVAIPVRGNETEETLVTHARMAAKGAKKGNLVAAAYDGEPSISTPKSA